MHYVRFDGAKEQERGDFEEIVRYADKPGAVGVVMELRGDLTEIDAAAYETEKAAILAYNAPFPAPSPRTPPATNEFKLAAYAYLGASAFVMPLAGYIAPALDALNAANWALARQIIGLAAQAQALTAEQYAHLNDLMAEHSIPEA